jgi:hypothetical protein
MTTAKQRKPLSFREYWEAVGTKNVEKVMKRAHSSMPVAKAIKYGSKCAHPDGLGARIVAAAEQITPGWAPDLKLLSEFAPRGPGRVTPPSPEFLASRKVATAKRSAA